MKVILMEKVVNLGGLGDVVKVKDGYARNFLIPQGKAKRATDANRRSSKRSEPSSSASRRKPWLPRKARPRSWRA